MAAAGNPGGVVDPGAEPIADGAAARLAGGIQIDANAGSEEAERSVLIACGILMERHHLGPADAAAHLDQVASEQGIDPAALADALVALCTPPRPGSPLSLPIPVTSQGLGQGLDVGARGGGTADAWRMLEDLPRMRASAVDDIVSAVASASEDGDAAAQLIADMTGAHPDRAVIYQVDEAALQLIGNKGTPAEVVVAWRHLPLSIDIPLCVSVMRDEALFFSTPDEMEHAFPGIRGSLEGTHAWASVPLHESGRVTGVVGLSWNHAVAFDETTRARIVRAVDRTGSTLVRSLRGRAAEPALLDELLHLIGDPWLVLAPLGGSVDDALVIEAVAPGLAGAAGWVGAPLLEAFPSLGSDGDLVADLQQVLHSGAPLVRTLATPKQAGPPWDDEPGEIRAVCSGRRLVVTWRALGR